MKITKEQIKKLRKDIDDKNVDDLGIAGEFTLNVWGRCPHCRACFDEDPYDYEDLKVDCHRCNLKFTVHLSKDDTRQISHVTIDEEQN